MQFICSCPSRGSLTSRNKFITGTLSRFCKSVPVVFYSRLGNRKVLKWKIRKVPVSELEGWYKARVIHNTHESEGHRSIRLEPPLSVLEQYTTPGMFVKLSNGKEKPNFFAVASAVNSPFLEFLVKRTHATSWLCELEKGGQVLISSVMGKGFQLSRLLDVEHIYLLATGSGISPLKAVIESPQFQQLATKKVGFGWFHIEQLIHIENRTCSYIMAFVLPRDSPIKVDFPPGSNQESEFIRFVPRKFSNYYGYSYENIFYKVMHLVDGKVG